MEPTARPSATAKRSIRMLAEEEINVSKSIGGISHDFAEDSRDEDIVLGCRVLADAAAAILSAENSARTGA